MEIYTHFYNTYGSVEEQFQARYGKKSTVEPKPIPVFQEISQEELDKIKNDSDLLKVLDNPENKPVY